MHVIHLEMMTFGVLAWLTGDGQRCLFEMLREKMVPLSLGIRPSGDRLTAKQNQAVKIEPESRRFEMNYKILSLSLIVTVIAAFFMVPGTVSAGGNVADKSGSAMPAEKSIQGTLTAMESYGHILIRPETGNLARLKVRPDAAITRNGKPAKLSDLHIGDKVRANYDSKNWVSELNATGS
jgi:hypothetical protein